MTTDIAPNPPRPLSLSQIRLLHTCAYAWKLRYEIGHLPTLSAAAWRGTLAHEAIRLAHHGVPLETAHRHVWQRACGPVLPQLDAFLALDAAYAAAGKPQTKAAQQWRQDHPAYDEACESIRSFQERALGHLRWGERASLQDYYAASVRMLDDEPDIVLPHPVLIEGEEADGMAEDNILAETEMRIDEDDSGVDVVEKRGYGLLPATLGALDLHCVPDVVALDPDGETVRVVDYKTSDRVLGTDALREDAQLHLYVLALRQNGYILPGQAVEVGHITLTNRGVARVFVRVEEAQHARVIARLEGLAQHAADAIATGRLHPQKGLHHPFMSPCTTCDYAHVCDA